MKAYRTILLAALMAVGMSVRAQNTPVDENPSPTEGVITHQFVDEGTMMADLLQMLANSMTYAKNIWYNCQAPNSVNEPCGFFKANSAGQSNEDGVRTNADFSMICAFLYKYAQGKATLPEGLTWAQVKDMAMKSLVFGYSTHKANKLKVTSNNAYWGSTATNDVVWESSLWAMSLAYASFFLADELSAQQKDYIYKMLKAECNYELARSIPTGFAGDTKAEENGWEADILAATLGLYPDDALAKRWFERLREFAINCYSQADDANDKTVIDPAYDTKTVADLYRGANLYEDFTLQNHNYFHTSYQNVVIQELGEAALALRLFQGNNQKWQTNALMHGNQAVMDNVLAWLALADGELAMPNGNDWSMFLFDQITSYSTLACFLRNPDALLLENMAYKYIKARQQTTADGSWLLNSDIGPRRMGVQGHRVMMTYLMHLVASTADLKPTTWAQFNETHKEAHRLLTQNIVRAASDDRFVTFSWSNGLKSYTGYFADTTPDRNKIVCPFKANNTGNLLGWYTVSGHNNNATPVVSGIYQLQDNAFTMNGSLNTNDATLENRFVLAATKGNAIVYMNQIKALANGTLTGRRGGLLAISTDPFTRLQRTLYHEGGSVQTNGAQMQQLSSSWVNIDQSVGIVTLGGTGRIGFGDRALSNSIYMSKLYPIYSTGSQAFKQGDVIDRTAVIYYSKVDDVTTQQLQAEAQSLTDLLPEGWNGLTCADPDGTRYLIVANFAGGSKNKAELKELTSAYGAPVLAAETYITDSKATAIIALDEQHSYMQPFTVFVKGSGVVAKQFNPWDDSQFSIRTIGQTDEDVTVTYVHNGQVISTTNITVHTGTTQNIRLDGSAISVSEPDLMTPGGSPIYEDVTAQFIANPNFEEDETWGTTGSITLNGTVYNPCYTQTVAAANKQFPQVLPVRGWKAESKLSPASNYALLYSMPYSFDRYCVSPSNVGNSTSIMAPPATFADEAGTRCLSMLSSWTMGTNAISQDITLPTGKYILRFNYRYTCPNESRRTAANVISTTGGNVCTSLCGFEVSGETDRVFIQRDGEDEQAYPGTPCYSFPTEQDTWQQAAYRIHVAGPQATITLRFGVSTTANQGAANQTRIYADNVRLIKLRYSGTGLTTPSASNETRANAAVYDLSGRPVRNTNGNNCHPTGKRGIYISNGQKVLTQANY